MPARVTPRGAPDRPRNPSRGSAKESEGPRWPRNASGFPPDCAPVRNCENPRLTSNDARHSRSPRPLRTTQAASKEDLKGLVPDGKGGKMKAKGMAKGGATGGKKKKAAAAAAVTPPPGDAAAEDGGETAPDEMRENLLTEAEVVATEPMGSGDVTDATVTPEKNTDADSAAADTAQAQDGDQDV